MAKINDPLYLHPDIAIRVSNVSKQYRLGTIGGGTLQRDLQSWWAKKRGLEDPNTKIGAHKIDKNGYFLALQNIDLSIRKGETIGIIGRNGAGKSTLLKMLSRVTAPTDGIIEINGKVTSMLEVGTGFHGEMTGRENIYMNGAILGMTRAEIDAKMQDIIEFSEVGEFIDTPVKRYSSGMYVKLAFAVAMHLESDIMIMDEVLAVGDMAYQQKCLNAMRKAAVDDGKTVLYVSHNMQTIKQLCDRCIVLDKGRIVFDGDADEAIKVYLDVRRNDDMLIDYEGMEPFGWMRFPKVKLIRAEYVGRSSNRFTKGEPANVRLMWENLEDIIGMSMRLEIRTMGDSPLLTYVLSDFYSGKKGDRAVYDISFDIDPLAATTYNTIYTFYQMDNAGNDTHVECRRGLCFEVADQDNGHDLRWRPNRWGYVKLESISAKPAFDQIY